VELDERTTWFYEAVTSTEGMVNPKAGAGQVYMTTKRDSQGNLLRAPTRPTNCMYLRMCRLASSGL
jgi:hypothetical protein